jgi:beta-N-acetylhexosaminidase
VFAPVADVNNNPANPVIHLRAFGEDPAEVAKHVRAFIEGAHSSREKPVLVTAKHFPGHGDTADDTHYGLATVTAPPERLRALELVPFRAAIEAGVDSIMTAHVTVPALEPAGIPATVSPAILTQLLRRELGFAGLLSTDALDMRGLTRFFDPGEAAVRALEAGADLLLMPADPRAAIAGVAAAVLSGRLPQARLDASVRKLLEAKLRLNLHRQRFVSLEAIPDELNSPEDQELAAQAAQRAVAAVRNGNGLLPLKDPENACVFVLPPARSSTLGEAFAAALQQMSPQTRVRTLTPELAPSEIEDAARMASSCGTVVAAYAAYNAAYAGGAALAGDYPALIARLMETGAPLALAALGNPYPLRHFPALPALATFSTVTLSEEAAARALLGRAPMSGRLPVSLPPPAPRE